MVQNKPNRSHRRSRQLQQLVSSNKEVRVFLRDNGRTVELYRGRLEFYRESDGRHKLNGYYCKSSQIIVDNIAKIDPLEGGKFGGIITLNPKTRTN